MKIAALQTVSTPDVERNLEAAARLIGEAAREGAALAALPEYFCLMGRRDDDKLLVAEAPGAGPIQAFLAAQARQHGLWLIGGTLPLRTAVPGRVRNACCVYAPDGTLAARYDKIHLFRYENERESYDEARVLDAGSEPVALQAGAVAGGPVGLLRPALSRAVPRLVRAALRPAQRARCVHLHHRPRALGAAAARPRGREPVLRRRPGAGRQARERAPHLGPQHDRRSRGARCLRCDPKARAWCWPRSTPQRIASVRQQLPALTHRRL